MGKSLLRQRREERKVEAETIKGEIHSLANDARDLLKSFDTKASSPVSSEGRVHATYRSIVLDYLERAVKYVNRLEKKTVSIKEAGNKIREMKLPLEYAKVLVAIASSCTEYLAYHQYSTSWSYRTFSSHGESGQERARNTLRKLNDFLSSPNAITKDTVAEFETEFMKDAKPLIWKGEHSLLAFYERASTGVTEKMAEEQKSQRQLYSLGSQ